jgi:hypothetical protein
MLLLFASFRKCCRIFGTKCRFELVNKMNNIVYLYEHCTKIIAIQVNIHQHWISKPVDSQFVTFIISQLAVLLLLICCYCLMLTLPVCELFCGVISLYCFNALFYLSESDKPNHFTCTGHRSMKDVRHDTYLICPFALVLIVPVPYGCSWLVFYFDTTFVLPCVVILILRQCFFLQTASHRVL